MGGRPIDFHGILDLDLKIVEQLECYLHEKENRLAYQILHTLREESTSISQSTLHQSKVMRLADAVEAFTKHLRQQARNGSIIKEGRGETEPSIKAINHALWEYTEVLEGCVIELFQQVKQLRLDKWHISLPVVVHAIKENLLHRIEDLVWGIRRLEKSLDEKYSANKGIWSRFFSKEGSLDPYILRNLQRTESFLKKKQSIWPTCCFLLRSWISKSVGFSNPWGMIYLLSNRKNFRLMNKLKNCFTKWDSLLFLDQ
jgi:hypothetical protein